MTHEEKGSLARWAGLLAVAGLLVFCLVLLGGPVAADEGPTRALPPWLREAVAERGAQTLAPAEQGDWDGFQVGWSCVVSETGGYRMWYIGSNPSSPGYGWQFGMAASPDGTTWTKDAANPVLGVGDPGDWDAMFRGQAGCIKDGATYKMWFTGGGGGSWETGYATSGDGVTWNVHPGNPVLSVGNPGDWDEWESDLPVVIKDGGLYHMWYTGCDADYETCSIGYATSADGVAWTKYAGNPVLEGAAKKWDEGYVGDPQVIKNGSTYMMWYQSGGKYGLATSPDGIDWTKNAGNPVLKTGWDGGAVAGATVLPDGATYEMWLDSGAGASRGIGYATSVDGLAWTMYGGNPVLEPGDPGLLIEVNYDHDWLQVRTLPTTTVAITVANGGLKATTGGETSAWGSFPTWNADWDPEQPDIMPGDAVTVTADGLATAVNPVGRIDAVVDLDADTLAGTVHAAWFAPQTLEVRCDVWEDNGPAAYASGVAADGGSFTCDFGAIGWDLEAWQEVAVRYYEPDGDSVIAVPPALQPVITVDYDDDWVDAKCQAGHTVWITVTESNGTDIRATAKGTSLEVPEWGWTGFSPDREDWVPAPPDIQTGDYVDVLLDNGYGGHLQVGLIDGETDVDTNVVSGTIHAKWLLPDTVTVRCEIHEEDGPERIEWEDVNPDGGAFTCDFGGEYDILPGHRVVVNYEQRDGHLVRAGFAEPAPDMRVEKWVEGNSEAAPGGPLVYKLSIRNDGDARAGTIVLTDSLPANTTYAADTSGETPAVGGGQVVWTLGPLDPGEEDRFYLVLDNTATPSTTLKNEADIYTLYDSQDYNNHAESDLHVAAGGVPDLYVYKHRQGDEPTPGETMLYSIDYGNDGPVPSGPVTLTDTLPGFTTVITWWSRNGYDVWQEQSRNGDLVLTAPTIPGYWGDELYIRVLVDEAAPLDTELVNAAEIYTGGETNIDNNYDERDDRVREPRRNVGVDKQFGWGRTVPGGEGEYYIQPQNHGNVATSVVMTETLPEGSSFLQSSRWTGLKTVPFPPTYEDGEVLVWDLGVMEPGDRYNLNVRLEYDADLEPGTVLENCATVAMDGRDGWPYDDESCVEVQIHGPGPNLRVEKSARWEWEGRIRYEIRFWNVGTTYLGDVVMTDTLPAGTSYSGNWWQDFWEDIEFSQSGDQLGWKLSRLDPGWDSRIKYEVDLDGGLVGVQGLAFTNMLEAPLTGDVYPADNEDEVVVYTGPDLMAEKWHSGGELLPGERITLTVRSGNQNLWPWEVDEGADVHLTERLPPGMTYVGAFWPDGNTNDHWFYDAGSGVVVWDFGSMGSDHVNLFYLVVDLDGDIPVGSVLLNELEVEEDPEIDVDPVPGNNTFTLELHIGKRTFLPLVLRKK